MQSKYGLNNVWRKFRLALSAFATIAQKSFNGKFTANIYLLIGYFSLSLLTLTLSLKSLHTLYDKYLAHMLIKFEQNRMVRNKQNFNHFGESVDAILEKVPMTYATV